MLQYKFSHFAVEMCTVNELQQNYAIAKQSEENSSHAKGGKQNVIKVLWKNFEEVETLY